MRPLLAHAGMRPLLAHLALLTPTLVSGEKPTTVVFTFNEGG